MDRSKEEMHARSSRVTMKASVKQKEERSSQTVKEVSVAVPLLARQLSRPAHSQAQGPGFISMKGLLTAQRFSKGLRERAAMKRAGCPPRNPVTIINEKVPTGCAQPKERFPSARVSQLVQGFLASRLGGVSYSAPSAGLLVQELSTELWGLVHAVCPARYKLVCTVTLGETGQEGTMLASRCLWDVHSDTCVSLTYQSPQLFCTATLFAVYYE